VTALFALWRPLAADFWTCTDLSALPGLVGRHMWHDLWRWDLCQARRHESWPGHTLPDSRRQVRYSPHVLGQVCSMQWCSMQDSALFRIDSYVYYKSRAIIKKKLICNLHIFKTKNSKSFDTTLEAPTDRFTLYISYNGIPIFAQFTLDKNFLMAIRKLP
jgi:hypothetical protein